MNNPNLNKSEKKIIKRITDMIIDAEVKQVHQILFNPTPEQSKKYWCDNCDGFHNTKNCPDKKYEKENKK